MRERVTWRKEYVVEGESDVISNPRGAVDGAGTRRPALSMRLRSGSGL
jgi:hypothetical protein